MNRENGSSLGAEMTEIALVEMNGTFTFPEGDRTG